LCQEDLYLRDLVRYIHLNPLRSRIVAEEVLATGKYPQNVRARGLLCYWGVREMGMTAVELSRKLNLSQPGISQSVKRGRKIAQDQEIILIEKDQLLKIIKE
jgi:hypothetical protein